MMYRAAVTGVQVLAAVRRCRYPEHQCRARAARDHRRSRRGHDRMRERVTQPPHPDDRHADDGTERAGFPAAALRGRGVFHADHVRFVAAPVQLSLRRLQCRLCPC